MKKLLTRFAGLAVFAFAVLIAPHVNAQGTHNSGIDSIRIRVKTGANTFIDVRAGSCGYGTTAPASTTDPNLINWGGTLGNSFCAPVAWAYGANQDTFGCASLPAGSLTGKVALIRRGGVPTACGFSAKALNAQNAGAVAVIIANHNLTATDTDCTVNGMQNGAEGSSVTIPVYFVCRAVADQIDAAIRAGFGEVCLLRPDVEIASFYLPTLSKKTPVSQIPFDTLGFFLTLTTRAGSDLTNLEAKAEVFDASNMVLHSTTKMFPAFTSDIVDSFEVISFGQFAPELPIGEYRVRFTTTASNGFGVTDAAETKFYVTDKQFAKDDGGTTAFRTAAPASEYGVGCIYTINPLSTEKFKATTAQFQFFADATEISPTAVTADIALFKIKDFVDFNNFGTTFADRDKFYSSSFDWVGTAPYAATSTTTNVSDQDAIIYDINSLAPGVELVNGKRYMLALYYSGNNKNVYHVFDEDGAITGYPSMFIFWPTAQGSTTNNWYSGFTGSEDLNVILRLSIDLLTTTDENPLPESSLQIRPNPIVETLNLQVELAEATDLTVTIADLTGRVITYEVREGFSNGLLSYQLPQLASGTYLARISTKEGTLTKKFIVQK